MNPPQKWLDDDLVRAQRRREKRAELELGHWDPHRDTLGFPDPVILHTWWRTVRGLRYLKYAWLCRSWSWHTGGLIGWDDGDVWKPRLDWIATHGQISSRPFWVRRPKRRR